MSLLLWFKLRPVVEIGELLIANMHNHVYLAVSIDILKFCGDRGLRWIVANDRRTIIDAGMRNIPAGKLNNHHPAVEVEKNKMGGMRGTVIMSDNLIDLVGPGIPICRILLMKCPPVCQILEATQTEAAITMPTPTQKSQWIFRGGCSG